MTGFHGRRIDVSKPSISRVYDYMLGGHHNYPVDLEFADKLVRMAPFVRTLARQNRAFLQRAVRFLASQGVRQFIDVGSGIPTEPNVHQVAREVDPSCRVAYVDNDLEAIVTSEEMLAGDDHAAMIEADFRQPSTLLDHPKLGGLIDFEQPVGFLIVSVLHFVLDEYNPHDLMRQYISRLPSGSYVALTHATIDNASAEARAQLKRVEEAYGETASGGQLRTREEVARFLTDSDLTAVEPGITYAADWRTEQPIDLNDTARPCFWAAVGHKP